MRIVTLKVRELPAILKERGPQMRYHVKKRELICTKVREIMEIVKKRFRLEKVRGLCKKA